MTGQGDIPWHKLRQDRLEKDGRSCVNCGESDDLEVHHIVPRSEGGSDILSNLRTLCQSCHNRTHVNINVPADHANPAETRWIPTIDSVKRLISKTKHPYERVIILLLAKTGMGVRELVDLKTKDVFLRNSISDLTEEIYFKDHPFIFVEQNNIGSGRGQGRRLCDTKFPIDSELKQSIKKYLAIRPDSSKDQLLLSISNWGEMTTPDIIHHVVEKSARSCGLYEEGVQVGDNLTPQRLIEFFKYRFAGQPATKQYLLGRKEKMPYSWSVLQTDYREGIYTLVD